MKHHIAVVVEHQKVASGTELRISVMHAHPSSTYQGWMRQLGQLHQRYADGRYAHECSVEYDRIANGYHELIAL